MIRSLLVAASVLFLPQTASAQDDLVRGQQLAERNCGPCHAVGAESDSPLAAAPAFRTLGQRYPIADLEEALAEGIVTAHPGMPEFVFEPDDISALLAFIASLQEAD